MSLVTEAQLVVPALILLDQATGGQMPTGELSRQLRALLRPNLIIPQRKKEKLMDEDDVLEALVQRLASDRDYQERFVRALLDRLIDALREAISLDRIRLK